MNKKFGFLAMPAFILALSLVLTGCLSAPPARSQSTGPQLRVTVTGIPSQYNGRLGWIQMDTGSTRNDPTVAWAMGNISNGSVTFNILDWTTDRSYNRTGNYFIAFFVWEDLDAARARGVEALWQGVIMSRDIGEVTSIEFSEFTRF
jgi:hypothetical protein